MISEMNFFERIVYILQNYGISYLKGAGTTLLIALVSTAIGCVLRSVSCRRYLWIKNGMESANGSCWDLSG